MAITTAERTEILKLVVLMFDAAPGATYLSEIVSIYEANGHSLAALADTLGDTAAFQTLHPNFQTAEEFAADFLTPLGLQSDSLAEDFVVSRMNAGETKAQIMYESLLALESLGADAAPQYLNALAILVNKEAVSEYFSVTQQNGDTSLADLQGVLQGVTADPNSVTSAEAALNTGHDVTFLTTHADLINRTGTDLNVIKGIVDGADATHLVQNSTYSNGDSITGNSFTELDLTVINGGQAAFAFVTGVTDINLNMATHGTIDFNAASWVDVGKVEMVSGVDGADTFLSNLHTGIGMGITHVTGTISATYDLGGSTLFLSLDNNDHGGAGAQAIVNASNDVTVTLAASASAAIGASTVSMGNVNIAGADHDSVQMHFGQFSSTPAHGDVTVGDIAVDLGNSSTAVALFAGISGDVSVGNVSLSAGDNSPVVLAGYVVDGNVTMGDISLHAGDSTNTTSFTFDGAAFVGVHGDVTLGNVALSAGSNAHEIFLVGSPAFFSGPALTNLAAHAGVHFNANALTGYSVTGNVSVGSLSLSGGDSSTLDAWFGGIGGDLTLGDVSMAAGDSSDLSLLVGEHHFQGLNVVPTFAATINGNVAVGNVTMSAGDSARATVHVSSSGDLRDVSVGDVTVSLGNSSFVTVDLENDQGINVGSLSVGNGDVAVGDDSQAFFQLFNTANVSTTTSNTGIAVGDVTVGNVTLSAGDATSLLSMDKAIFFVENVGFGGLQAGSLAVGDVSVSVGSGFVSGTHHNESHGLLSINEFGADGMGDFAAGNLSMSGGDFASLTLSVSGAAQTNAAVVGNMTVGNLSIDSGESANIAVNANWDIKAFDGTLGDMTLGNMDVTAAQDSLVQIEVTHNIAPPLLLAPSIPLDPSVLGNLSVGDVHVVMGDNSTADLSISQTASFHSLSGASDGNFAVGNVSIAVSATNTVDLSGGSVIDVAITKSAWSLDSQTGGTFSVGDVSLSAGNAASITLNINDSGSFANMGNAQVGAVSLTAGDNANNVQGHVFVANYTAGNIGDVSVGGLALSVGNSSTGTLDVTIDKNDTAGNIGAVLIGDIGLNAGEGSNVVAALSFQSLSAGAVIGGIDVGNVSVTVEDGSLGKVTLDATAANLGHMTVGDINLVAKDTGVTTTTQMTPGTSNTLTTTVTSTFDVGSTVHMFVTDAGDANDTLTVGNVNISVAGTAASDEVWLELTSGANIKIGDITVSGAGTFILDGLTHTATTNVSFLSINETGTGTITVGNIDFSGYANAITIDASGWLGAGSITGGAKGDIITGNATANIITGGKGADLMTGDAGHDTFVINQGDSGIAATKYDVITDFVAGSTGTNWDKLDFNYVAATTGNFAIATGNFGGTLATFLSDAADNLNSTVKYFAESDGAGNTYVAVNFGSGEADLIVELVGVTASALVNANIIA